MANRPTLLHIYSVTMVSPWFPYKYSFPVSFLCSVSSVLAALQVIFENTPNIEGITKLFGIITQNYPNCSVVMKTGSVAHLSNYQNSNKSTNNKIPDYAKEYKREYQFIRGLNKEFRYLSYFIENIENEEEIFKDYKLDRIMKMIKRFLRAQETGKFKDISHLKFDHFDINNIYEVIKDISPFSSTCILEYVRCKGINDDNESLLSCYEKYKHDLDLFLSKLNIEIEYYDDS